MGIFERMGGVEMFNGYKKIGFVAVETLVCCLWFYELVKIVMLIKGA